MEAEHNAGPAEQAGLRHAESRKSCTDKGPAQGMPTQADVAASPALDFDPFVKYGGVGPKTDLSKGYLVVMQHPVTTEYAESLEQIRATLAAAKRLWAAIDRPNAMIKIPATPACLPAIRDAVAALRPGSLPQLRAPATVEAAIYECARPVMIAPPTAKGAETTTGPIAFGKMWRRAMRIGRTPSARAADRLAPAAPFTPAARPMK